MSARTIGTEIYGLDFRMEENRLELLSCGEKVIASFDLNDTNAEKVGLELAKAQLWEWNRFAEIKHRTEKRNERSFRAWLLMAAAAVAAHSGYPGYWLAVITAVASCALWHWAKLREDQATRAAREERMNFFPDWVYLRRRFDEFPMVTVVGPTPPPGVG